VNLVILFISYLIFIVPVSKFAPEAVSIIGLFNFFVLRTIVTIPASDFTGFSPINAAFSPLKAKVTSFVAVGITVPFASVILAYTKTTSGAFGLIAFDETS
jgi:hypothetical protein